MENEKVDIKQFASLVNEWLSDAGWTKDYYLREMAIKIIKQKNETTHDVSQNRYSSYDIEQVIALVHRGRDRCDTSLTIRKEIDKYLQSLSPVTETQK